MDIRQINISAAGTWPRDCELISLTKKNGLTIIYHKDSDDSYWSLKFEIIPAYKVTGEEFSTTGYLINLPADGSFFEIIDSPWLNEFRKNHARIIDKCKHYVLQFYDETIEIIASIFTCEQLKKKPDL